MALSIESRFSEVSGGSLHVADFGGTDNGEVVCVHGLGGSHANWMSVADGFGEFGRVTAPDLPGFGLTPPEGRSCTVTANRKVLDTYLRTLETPVILVGNSMGGTIALLQTALAPETVRGLVLLAPALPAGETVGALRWLGEALDIVRRRPRLGDDPLIISRWTWELCTTRPDLVSKEVMEAHLEVAEARIDDPDFESAIRRAAVSLVALLSNRRLL
ncbi:MAG: alpha/beta fold hydrolase, partial [Acidimicrobiia bacterium]|nr:alpha/beta fold hydrolase [Acidimicrobiia bacterium]